MTTKPNIRLPQIGKLYYMNRPPNPRVINGESLCSNFVIMLGVSNFRQVMGMTKADVTFLHLDRSVTFESFRIAHWEFYFQEMPT